MTSPHVSEQEVEAAAKAIAHADGDLAWVEWMPHASAALTAAAQVRERVGPAPDLNATLVGLSVAVVDPRWPLGNDRHKVMKLTARAVGQIVTALHKGGFLPAKARPVLMPIYGATEDPAEHPGQRLVNEYMNSQGLRVVDETEPTEDQGPDVLGERKEEE